MSLQRIKMENSALFLIPLSFVLCIVGVAWYYKRKASAQIESHPMLCEVRFKRLAFNSPTRLRLQCASNLFGQGWKALKSNNPGKALEWFAKAVEIDELACGWKKGFEEKLELVGVSRDTETSVTGLGSLSRR